MIDKRKHLLVPC